MAVPAGLDSGSNYKKNIMSENKLKVVHKADENHFSDQKVNEIKKTMIECIGKKMSLRETRRTLRKKFPKVRDKEWDRFLKPFVIKK